MLAREAPDADHPGALVITRRIADCIDLAEQINRYGRRGTAVAYHEGNDRFPSPKLDLEGLSKFPVLVITHSAFQRGFETDPAKSKLRHFFAWRPTSADGTVDPFGERRLRIVDDALDIVKSLDLCFDGLKETWAAIPARVMKQYPLEMALLNDALEQLRDYTFASKDKKEPRFSMAIGNTSLPDFEDLISDSFPVCEYSGSGCAIQYRRVLQAVRSDAN